MSRYIFSQSFKRFYLFFAKTPHFYFVSLKFWFFWKNTENRKIHPINETFSEHCLLLRIWKLSEMRVLRKSYLLSKFQDFLIKNDKTPHILKMRKKGEKWPFSVLYSLQKYEANFPKFSQKTRIDPKNIFTKS